MVLTKKFGKKISRRRKIVVFITTLSIILGFNILVGPNALAYTNLVSGGSFENDIPNYWTSWQEPSSIRSYSVYRSFDPAFGFGSHSLAIEADGSAPEQRWMASITGETNRNNFRVEAGRTYNVAVYVKGSSNMNVSVFMQDNTSYQALAPNQEIPVTTNWERHILTFNPSAGGNALLGFMYGDMPTGSTLYIDGVQVVELNLAVATPSVIGNIGDQDKFIKINNISFYTANEIEVELPYFDNTTNQATTRRFQPSKYKSDGIYINLYEQTFPGVGYVYVSNQLIGSFDYNINPRITEFHPSLVRAEQDLVIYGSGFHPQVELDKIFVIIQTINADGKTSDTWLKPHTIDPSLKHVAVSLPLGVKSGRVYIQTSFRDKDEQDIVKKSNTLQYNVKPIIYELEWSERGYNQVGDKLTIKGKGISNQPTVIFYDDNDNVVYSRRAKVLRIDTEEVIEVETNQKYNQLHVTVKSGSEESDYVNALTYTAKPILNTVVAKKTRYMSGGDTTMPGARIGEEITFRGQGIYSLTATTTVDFQGISSRITVSPTQVDKSGTFLKVVVPEGAQNGYINFTINGENSNYLPVEIIPTVLSISPSEVTPGENITITATGLAPNINLTRIHFQVEKGNTEIITPESATLVGNNVQIVAKAPYALSNKYTSVNVQYDKWVDDSSSVLNVRPHITSASVDMDSKILSIRGYGFSIFPKENTITYMYADESQTVISPKVKMLGVYPTEEGQEIRIKINDEYHYGWVRVQVGDFISNDANFGPASIKQIARRSQYVESEGRVMGVLYISGYNFGTGDVRVGEVWANTHYRNDFYIIAVVEEANLYDNPVIVTRE